MVERDREIQELYKFTEYFLVNGKVIKHRKAFNSNWDWVDETEF